MNPTVLRAIPALVLLAAAPAAADGLSCKAIPRFVGAFLQNHVAFHQLDAELKRRTVESYIRRSDPSRTVLLEKEAKQLQDFMLGAFEEIEKGDCSRLLTVHSRLVARHREVQSLVDELVSDPAYEIDSNVAWVVDPDDRGNPKTDEDRKALIEAQTHFQMSNYLAADTALEEARELLVQRYERRTKRFAELEENDLYSAFLDAFAVSLDPHSNYLSAEVLEDFRIQMSLSLEGIGVALSEHDGYAVVERIIPGGAADRLGVLEPKDKLIAVAQDGSESVSIIDMPLRDAVGLIRGKKGSRVHLTVLRQAETAERFPVTIERDTINLEEQAASLRFVEKPRDGGKPMKLAVLELPSFYGDTDPGKRQCTEDVARLLRQVAEEKADGLVLDLSRNGGGLLEHAVTVSGFFLRKGEIVGIENAQGQRQVLSDQDQSVLYAGPMVVHTSRVSASAAEILAGALKDYKRAVIAGDDHTFGKGTVQTVSALPPGQGALKVTTAMFFRPGGKSTQNGGVQADVIIPSLLSVDDFGEKNQPYALESERGPAFLSSFANAAPANGRWKPLTSDLIGKLIARSKKRLAESEAFAKVRERLKESQENGGVIRLAEIEKRREEERAKKEQEENGDGKADAEVASEHEEDSPQLEEAINVLADLVELTA